MTRTKESAATLTPTAILMAEHRNIEKVLACLERMADAFEASGEMDRRPAGDALEFLRTYADRLHHGKEEANLFPAMEERGVPREMGPTAVMRQEHDMGRGLVRDMAAAIEAGDLDGFVAAARDYVGLLRDHIAKEDQVLFPMADGILPPEQQDELLRIFERVEERDIGPDAIGRMIAICGSLCARYGVVEAPSAVRSGGGCGQCCGH